MTLQISLRTPNPPFVSQSNIYISAIKYIIFMITDNEKEEKDSLLPGRQIQYPDLPGKDEHIVSNSQGISKINSDNIFMISSAASWTQCILTYL